MEKPLEVLFRENLKFYRQRVKLSQEKLSELLDKNINYINLIECGKSIPPLSVIEQIATIFGIEPHYFFEPHEKNVAFDKASFIEKAAKLFSDNAKAILSDLLKE